MQCIEDEIKFAQAELVIAEKMAANVLILKRRIEDYNTLLNSGPWAPRQFNNADEEKV